MSLRSWVWMGIGSFAVALALSACDGGQQALCDCADARAQVAQPALSSPVVSVDADAPCVASLVSSDGGLDVYVDTQAATGSCQVHETLADGTVLVAVFSFASGGGTGCCADAPHAVAPFPMFTQGNDGTP